MSMIDITVGDSRFFCRVAGVLISRGRVLFQRGEHDDFWALPGGRAEIGETSIESVKREMLEESGLLVEVERLLWLAEVFYASGGTQIHTLGFYFLLNLPADSPVHDLDEPFYGIEEHDVEEPIKLIFQWFDIDALEDEPVYPLFLRTALRQLPQTVEHIITIEKDVP